MPLKNYAILQRRRSLRRNMTKAEEMLWYRIRAKRFFGLKFRRQYSVGLFVVDFYCHQAKLAIELDGDSHFDDISERRDKKRQHFIEARGIHILRFTNTEVYQNIEAVLGRIKDVIG